METHPFNFQAKLEPIKGVLIFFIVLFVSNLFWKLSISGDEANSVDSMVTFWGINVSAPFNWMAHQVAYLTASVLHFFGYKVILEPSNILRHSNGNSVMIIWACTGIKQAYICICIIAFSRGPWHKKLWFIPLSLIIVYLFNIFRITFIAACMANHPNWFHFLHVYVFKYIFYGIIFLMWVLWEEVFVTKNQKKV